MATAVLQMQKAEEIEAAVPRSGTVYESSVIPSWKESVDRWMNETDKFLASCSPQASAAFLHHVGGSGVTVHYGGIAKDAHDYYVFLLARTNNLRAIMEKSDIYF
jgi:hypothetical protein